MKILFNILILTSCSSVIYDDRLEKYADSFEQDFGVEMPYEYQVVDLKGKGTAAFDGRIIYIDKTWYETKEDHVIEWSFYHECGHAVYGIDQHESSYLNYMMVQNPELSLSTYLLLKDELIEDLKNK